MKVKELSADIVIVGSGGAGLRAAIEAADKGAKVLVICKSLHRKAHTVMAEGGIAAPLANVDKKDSWKSHANDTLKDGLYLGNKKMIATMTKDANQIILELENWGAIFDRTKNGKIHQRPFGAHSHDRVCHIGDRTGLEIVQILADQCRKRNIKYLDETIVTNLLTDNKKIVGITAIDMTNGKFIAIKSKSVILATGGYARIYKTNTNPWECTGDGIALAYEQGIELIDMEMVQFHPTGMVFPDSAKGILVTESVRGDGGILTNKDKERFMKKYDPKRMELSARDIVARAIYTEIKEGRGTELGGVYLDISHKPKDYILKKLPNMVQQFRDFANIDITRQRMEVAPTAHYTMGGIKISSDTCMTSINGLFAVGETAVSVHGGNRLGGNSLIDILVFGKICGKSAVNYSKYVKGIKIKQSDIDKEIKRLRKPFSNKKGIKPQRVKNKIPKIMEKYVGVQRNEKGLKKALLELKKIALDLTNLSVSGSFLYNKEFNDFLDVHSMFICAKATTIAALKRKESRGAHYRLDYPALDDKWLFNLSVYKDKTSNMQTSKQSISNPKKIWKE